MRLDANPGTRVNNWKKHLRKLQAYLVLLHFALLSFMDIAFFTKLKARLFTSKKFMLALLWYLLYFSGPNRTCNISKVYLYIEWWLVVSNDKNGFV